MRKHPIIIPLILFMAVFTLSAPVLAENVIRYKPILVQGGDNNLYPPKVIIVDTKDGHVWLWQERGKKDSLENTPDAQIIYQGKVMPGRAPGDIVSTTKGHK